MDIPLHPDLECFIREQTRAGDYGNPAEVVTEALFLLWQRDQGLGAGTATADPVAGPHHRPAAGPTDSMPQAGGNPPALHALSPGWTPSEAGWDWDDVPCQVNVGPRQQVIGGGRGHD